MAVHRELLSRVAQYRIHSTEGPLSLGLKPLGGIWGPLEDGQGPLNSSGPLSLQLFLNRCQENKGLEGPDSTTVRGPQGARQHHCEGPPGGQRAPL